MMVSPSKKGMNATQQAERRVLRPGSTGWSADELYDDPDLREQWNNLRIELVHGVIAEMPPAYFAHGRPTGQLVRLIENHMDRTGTIDVIASTGEVDIRLQSGVLYRADAVVITREQLDDQRRAQRECGRRDDILEQILVPPMLVIESVSECHESHDWDTKWRDYAAFGIPNYWIASYVDRSLTCMKLRDGDYVIEVQGRGEDVLKPTLFPGLVIPVAKLFV